MPVHAVRTVAPFLVGWVLWAPILGSYRRRTRTGCRGGLARVGGAWLAASVTGAVIRATALVPGEAPVIFVMVVFGIGATVLLPWRALVCLSARA